MPRRLPSLAIACVLFVLGCSSGGGGGGALLAPNPPADLALQPMPGVYSWPVLVTAPPQDARLFVVEHTGLVRIIENGSVRDTPFLDLTSEVRTAFEPGLLSLAFDPHYAQNGRFFVTLADNSGNEDLMLFHASADPEVASANGQLLLSFPHPNDVHWGGMLQFGLDGMLYMSVGDGGSPNDVDGHGQGTTELYGAILRLDVRSGSVAIPPDNPYHAPARPELWAIGLRNPWRFSIDHGTGNLYIGDVGEETWEEIDVALAAAGGGRHANFGWNIMEGNHCFSPDSGCNTVGLTRPTIEYHHGVGCAVIGGYVYRGTAIPGLAGTYFYSDYCEHLVHSFYDAGGTVLQQRDWPNLDPGEHILSFGQDAAGELYESTEGGHVYKIVSGTAVAAGREAAPARASRDPRSGTSG